MSAPYLMDVQPQEPFDWYKLEQVIAAINGYVGFGVPWVLTDISTAGVAVAIKNANPLGTALAVYASNSEVELVVDDDGVAITDLFIVDDLEVGDDLLVNGTATVLQGINLTGNLAMAASGLIDFDDAVGSKIQLGNSAYGIGLNSSELTLFTGGGANSIVVRSNAWNGTVLGYLWHSGNDGIASLLNADLLDDRDSGNASGNIPISNGILCVNLNADMVDSFGVGTSGGIAVTTGALQTGLNSQFLGGLLSADYALAHSHPYAPSSHASGSNTDHDARYSLIHSHPYAADTHATGSNTDHDARYALTHGHPYSGTGHDHNSAYAPLSHASGSNADHDSRYAAAAHATGLNTDHDARYALTHSHPYASSSHNHDGDYINEGGDSASGSYSWSGDHTFDGGVSVGSGSSLSVNTSVFKADNNNVGIGTASPNGSYILDVQGDAIFSANVLANDFDAAQNVSMGYARFRSHNGSGLSSPSSGSISAYKWNGSGWDQISIPYHNGW